MRSPDPSSSAGRDPSPSSGRDLRRRFNFGTALLVILFATIALLLVTPLDGLNLHPAVIALQHQTKEAVILLSPYFLVALAGAAVGLAELSSTFNDYPREAIATEWGQYLIWLNAVAAALAFFVASVYAPVGTNKILMIVTVGFGFPALIRTKVTLAKQFGGGDGGDLSVNFGWLYDQFQNVCKKQIDLDLMSYRRMQVDRLLTRYSTVQELYQTALYTIKARATLTTDEEQAKLEELQQTIDPKVPPEVARMNLGLLILELGGVAFVDLLVGARGAPMPAPPLESVARGEAAPAASASAPPPPADTSTDAVVKKLVEMPLADLVAFGNSLLEAQADRDWIEKAAQPAAGISELKQKAPIAFYVVSRVGAEAAARE